MSYEAVVSVKDPLTVTVSNAVDVVIEKGENGEIVSLDIPDIPTIKLGNKLIIGKYKEPYRVNRIVMRESFGLPVYDLKIATRTKSSLFILPMLPGAKYLYYYDKLLLNAFVGTQEQKDVIALLYRWSGIKGFSEMERAFTKLNTFISHHDPDKKTVLYVFRVPKKYKGDFQKFKEGKYSEITETYKRRILDFHNVDKSNILGKILYKDKTRMEELRDRLYDIEDFAKAEEIIKDAELYSIPNMDNEVYNPETYLL